MFERYLDEIGHSGSVFGLADGDIPKCKRGDNIFFLRPVDNRLRDGNRVMLLSNFLYLNKIIIRNEG